jgi:chemotaxis protein CheC
MDCRWSELEHDALCEAFNVGVGSAAALLAPLAGAEVTLSVPAMRMARGDDVFPLFGLLPDSSVRAVRQVWHGSFTAQALLLFATPHSDRLIQALLPARDRGAPFDAPARAALERIGAALLEACLGAVTEVLHTPLAVTITDSLDGPADRLIAACLGPDWASSSALMLLHMDFSVGGDHGDGCVGLLLDATAIAGLHAAVARYLTELT